MNERKEQLHIALIFSIIFPGAGFLYLKKWFLGIVGGLIHLFLIGLLLVQAIKVIFDQISNNTYDITILILIVSGTLFNWLACIRGTQE